MNISFSVNQTSSITKSCFLDTCRSHYGMLSESFLLLRSYNLANQRAPKWIVKFMCFIVLHFSFKPLKCIVRTKLSPKVGC